VAAEDGRLYAKTHHIEQSDHRNFAKASTVCYNSLEGSEKYWYLKRFEREGDVSVVNPTLLLSSFSDEPIYNVKAVCQRTGITAATLRAWERRYGLPTPNRTAHGYRLYSERDVAILFWLIQQTENGMSIGQAVSQLTNMLVNGIDPTVRVPETQVPAVPSGPRSPDSISRDLANAITTLDERYADQFYNEAAALYTLETTLINVLRGALHLITDQRARGEVPITVERFAMNYARQRLLHMIQTTPSALRAQSPVITIGFPGEQNEIDLLIVGLLLRRAGWSVVHLGNELEPSIVQSALNGMHASVILYYTDQPANAIKLVDFSIPMDNQGRPIWCVCGGRALQIVPSLQDQIPFEYLGVELRGIFGAIVNYLEAQLNAVRVRPSAQRKAAQ
jgi:DNA-binding transcriptional MerR regulator